MNRKEPSPLCPCGSGKLYETCCKHYHEGQRPPDALTLMRSRYSAYARHLADFIIDTTHPSNPNTLPDRLSWAAEILAFTHNTRFERLEILEFRDGDPIAYVRFTAYLSQGGADVSFTEDSRFEKLGGRWLYRYGKPYGRQ